MSMLSPLPPGSYDVRPRTGFTSTLFETILASQAKLDQWVAKEKSKVDRMASRYSDQYVEEKAKVDSKVETLLSVQLERGLNIQGDNESKQCANGIAAQKKSLDQRQTELQAEITKLQLERESRKNRVNEISREENRLREQANKARTLKKDYEDAKKTTVDDLTRGIVNYKYLGLDFVRTNTANELRFAFTRLDPNDESRQFSFLLQINEHDKYEIANCEPEVPMSKLVEIADTMNNTEDMSYVVREMRHAFVDSLHTRD
eukprot:Nitzschia sp. Nitz4//scaffold3_size479765//244831//245752//NITZ4_000104-RA/size479765-augustus-gene-1.572-mRNA-1//1//CDS//3329550770//2026//frame0